jgi:hypothetical protein
MANEGYSGDAIAALLFMQSSATTMDVYSALNSSPWTAESFGADERRSKALKEYVTHAVVYSMGYAIVAGILAQQKYAYWIVASAAATNVYLIWLYMRAMRRGKAAGSAEWANS